MELTEAIKNREECLEYLEGIGKKASPDCLEAVRWSVKALKALRPVSREQVRRGTIIETIKDGRANRVFSCCGHDFTELTCWFMPDFCPSCGAPMTDEAVQMVMERLEALHETT